MNKIFTFLAFIISLSAFSQKSNLIVFNNSGQQFFVVLNGIRQNSVPKTNVKIEGLAPVSYKVKIIFADGKTGDIDKNVYLEPNMEYSAQVIIKNPKKRSLRLFDLVPLNTSPYGAGSETVTYRPNDAAGYSDQQGNVQAQTNATNNANVNGQVQNGNGTVQSNANINGVPTGTATVTTSGNMGTTNPNGNGTVQSNVNVNGVPTGTATVTTSGNMGTTNPNGNGTVQSSVNINGVPMGTATVTTSGNMGTTTQNGGVDYGMPANYSQSTVTNPDGSQTITTTVNGQTTTVTTHPGLNGQINMGMNGVPMNGTQTSTTTVNGQTTTVTTNVSGTGTNTSNDPYGNGRQTTTTTINGQTTQVTTNGTHTHADGTVHDHNHKPVNAGTHTHSDGTVHDHNHKPVMPMGVQGDAIVNANGTLTCRTAVKDVDVLVNGIKQENFSEDKMDLVRMSLNKKCINSDQAVQIVKSFSFDGDKIEMAKFCYDHMTDTQNSIKLLELFSYSSSKDELKKYFSR